MKLLFLTMVKINSVDDRGIYQDLLRKFRDEGHEVYVVSPSERREKLQTSLKSEKNVHYLNIRTFNLQKTNVIEKGIGTLAMEYQYLAGIKKFYGAVSFDLVLYSTPPITFSKVISYIKKRDNATSYLLLKDIFPQNAVDMKMLKNNGFLHKLFLRKEKRLYAVSDHIGCMSDANREYVLAHNPETPPEKVEINPNSIEPVSYIANEEEARSIRTQYKIPPDAVIFIYGGNLGIPQGIDFLIETLAASEGKKDIFFIVIGSGTEYGKIESWFRSAQPKNALLLAGLPKVQYDQLLKACDVGLIFLSRNFTIPNFPSRLLSYLEYRMPVIAATDAATDIGKVIEDARCGFSVLSGDIAGMLQAIEKLSVKDAAFETMRDNAVQLLTQQYTVSVSYHQIMKHFTNV